MMTIMTTSVIIFVIANILMILCMVISKKSMFDREKYSAFECGFDQKSSSRMPFSMQFFLITIIFLIFDVEIALLLPSISMISLTTMYNWVAINTTFLLILLGGILHEWNQGMLGWSK
uniref:NADH-ubiquinone oxidoreductase chain 3 n=1 Tax=Teliapsocus conterminus TaxID=1407779 RepID=A0A8K1ZG79_9NEOP|nr:NADH dehydrogenase subunit 3 [Teliapsocus conterminus]